MSVVSDDADLEVDQGSDFTTTTNPWLVAGSPQNLTGYSASLMVRQSPTDNLPLLSLTATPNANGSVVTPLTTTGTVTITFGNADTALFPYASGPLEYELTVTSGAGKKTSVQRGRLLINPSLVH